MILNSKGNILEFNQLDGEKWLIIRRTNTITQFMFLGEWRDGVQYYVFGASPGIPFNGAVYCTKDGAEAHLEALHLSKKQYFGIRYEDACRMFNVPLKAKDTVHLVEKAPEVQSDDENKIWCQYWITKENDMIPDTGIQLQLLPSERGANVPRGVMFSCKQLPSYAAYCHKIVSAKSAKVVQWLKPGQKDSTTTCQLRPGENVVVEIELSY